MTGTLYLVATPIGNLEDITLRALRVLREVNLIACEDTRHTGVLLNHFGIKQKTTSYHEHNELEKAAEIVALLEQRQSVALVSDAGTPAVSDPGYRLVCACIERGLRVVPIPGPTAVVAALVASGLPTDEFFFGGFLPPKSVARRQRFLEVKGLRCTLIFYEAPHRIAQCLIDAQGIFGNRRSSVARELTKVHEEFARGTLSELARHFSDERMMRGEMVLLISGREDGAAQEGPIAGEMSISARVAALEAEGLDHKLALKRVAREMGLARDDAYRRLIAERTLKE